jgi:polyhydroxybutyrate depolymerase
MHYLIDGGGHTWPGSPYIIGITNEDFNASAEIWRFFNQYSLATAVHDADENRFSVYPDPFMESFTVMNPERERMQMVLYSPEGKIMKSISTDLEEYLFHAGGLSNGIYFLKISGSTTKMIRLIHYNY